MSTNELCAVQEQIELRTGCKINLHLEITATRADGYHELATLFYPLPEPSDILRVSPGPDGKGLAFSCSADELATPDNLVVKAYEAFAAASGFRPDLLVHLEKNIPFGAGLGGGSTDAAALLTYLNSTAGAQALPSDALHSLAAGLGADVPFFLHNKACWAEGIGDKFCTEVPFYANLSGMVIVLVCPDVHVNTAWAYSTYDKVSKILPKDDSRFLTAPDQLAYCLSCSSSLLFFNRFEAVVYPTFPELRLIKEELLKSGAVGALMSGSGSSIFGVFRNSASAEEAARTLSLSHQKVFTHYC